MNERVEWVTERRDLAALQAQWDALARRGGGGPFMTHAWLTTWLGAFAADAPIEVCVAWRERRLVGALPLLRTQRGLAAMANGETPSFQPLALDSGGLRAVVSAALRANRRPLTLPMVPLDHPVMAHRHRTWSSLYTPNTVSPIVDTRGTFAQWRELTRPRWRAPIERLARKMAREHEMTLRLVQAPDDLQATMDAGLAVEAAGWKGREGTAIASSASTAAFYRSIAQTFAAREELRVSSIHLDGELVAFALCLLYDNRLWQLKIAFLESRRALAPGLVLHLAAIERCFEMRLDAYELLGDRAEWKQKFATAEREHVTWTGYAHTPSSTARYVARQGARALRRARACAVSRGSAGR